jgi:hypothetical protein
LWSVADAHTEDGFLAGYTRELIDGETDLPGFTAACESIGWLEVSPQGVTVPRFTEHNGKSAKRRAQESARKKSVRKVSASHADKKRTREEKRREEKSTKKDPPIVPQDEIDFPDGMDTPEVRSAITEWSDYKRTRGETYKKPALQIGKLLAGFASPADFVAAVNNSIAQNYAGCFPPKGNNHGTQPVQSPARIHRG